MYVGAAEFVQCNTHSQVSCYCYALVFIGK